MSKELFALDKQHRTLDERAKEYGGKLGPYQEFDWGEPVGREGGNVYLIIRNKGTKGDVSVSFCVENGLFSSNINISTVTENLNIPVFSVIFFISTFFIIVWLHSLVIHINIAIFGRKVVVEIC